MQKAKLWTCIQIWNDLKGRIRISDLDAAWIISVPQKYEAILLLD
jgi:hypothetical protein